MENKNRPSYYAIIPAEVRYDKDLPPNAKLLYGELTALSSTTRGCFARNKYFADLYGVSDRIIRQWIALLEEKGYIERTSGRWTESGEREIKIRTSARPKFDLESYDEIFKNCNVSGELKRAYIEFIKHCQLNGRIVTNDKLYRIIVCLDMLHSSDEIKIESLYNAIDGGYFDIAEHHSELWNLPPPDKTKR